MTHGGGLSGHSLDVFVCPWPIGRGTRTLVEWDRSR